MLTTVLPSVSAAGTVGSPAVLRCWARDMYLDLLVGRTSNVLPLSPGTELRSTRFYTRTTTGYWLSVAQYSTGTGVGSVFYLFIFPRRVLWVLWVLALRNTGLACAIVCALAHMSARGMLLHGARYAACPVPQHRQ